MSQPTKGPNLASPKAAYWVAFAAAVLGIVYGYDQSNVGGAQLYFQEDLGLTTQAVELIATMVVIGELIGAICGGWIINKYGRRNTMVAVASGYVIFCLTSAISPGEVTLDISRLFLGFTIGVSLVAAPIFIAESVPAERRGRTLVMYQVATVTGVILGFLGALLLANVNPSYNWRLMLGLAAIPALAIIPILVRLPKTPRWLMMVGREEEARKSLAMVDPTADLDAEIANIKDALSDESGGGIGEMFRKPYLRATVFVVTLGFFIQITGINATITYGPAIFKQMGIDSNEGSILMSVLVQCLALIAVLFAMRYVDRWGRRPVLLTGITIMIASQICLVAVFATQDGDTFNMAQKVFGFIGIAGINIGFVFGFGGLVWVYSAESFPARLRGYGSSAMLTADLVANVIVAILFLSVMEAIGGAWSFGIFAILAVGAWIFVYFVAPETKGRDIDDIRLYWENGGKWPEEAKASADSE